MTRRDERGSATVELTLLVPAMMLLLAITVAGGRIWFARATVAEAAYTSARAASLARTAGAAAEAGRQAGEASLATVGLSCADRSVEVSTDAFAVPAGTPATVRAVVRCRVAFDDLLLPGTPGSISLQADGAAALDTYRGRG